MDIRGVTVPVYRERLVDGPLLEPVYGHVEVEDGRTCLRSPRRAGWYRGYCRDSAGRPPPGRLWSQKNSCVLL